MQQRNALQAIKNKCFQCLKVFQTSTVRDHSLFLGIIAAASLIGCNHNNAQIYLKISDIIKALIAFSHLHGVHHVFVQSERQVRNSTAPADKVVWQQQRQRKETLLLYSQAGSGDAAGCLRGNWIFSHKWIHQSYDRTTDRCAYIRSGHCELHLGVWTFICM